ncbi:MAG: tRNA (adenosine(37)-N6)-threonylcarbamoyltransferase complex dimerization subunit type 1 TsaB [Deltaproteobacteria bacterium]|nr:tRNA (adenosine(37)-N6)-threonylcarbamoyltransferase complex dimerization subunit type 1 TsaB [Deltaproteobacteria bacterium]
MRPDKKLKPVKIAAFDTSSSSGSIAILDDGRLVAELNVPRPGLHAEWLLEAFGRMLKDIGAAVSDIDLYAVGAGPGSFTGLRIGISVVKGLAWACGKRVAGVSTLEALAMNLRGSDIAVCPILDARKGEVYAAVYGFNGEAMRVIIEEAAFKPAILFARIREAGLADGVIFLGEGLRAYQAQVMDNLPGAAIAPAELWHVRALNVAMLAMNAPEKMVEPGALVPVYLRKSEVEVKAARPGA